MWKLKQKQHPSYGYAKKALITLTRVLLFYLFIGFKRLEVMIRFTHVATCWHTRLKTKSLPLAPLKNPKVEAVGSGVVYLN